MIVTIPSSLPSSIWGCVGTGPCGSAGWGGPSLPPAAPVNWALSHLQHGEVGSCEPSQENPSAETLGSAASLRLDAPGHVPFWCCFRVITPGTGAVTSKTTVATYKVSICQCFRFHKNTGTAVFSADKLQPYHHAF